MGRYIRKDRQPSKIREQLAEMKEALRAEKRNDPLPVLADMIRKRELVELDQCERIPQSDDSELIASLQRLEETGRQIAIREHPRTFRIIESETERGIALVQGFSLWAPRDMFEYIHLPPDQREKLRRFKKVFVDAAFDWGKYRG